MLLLDGDVVENSRWVDTRFAGEAVVQVSGIVTGDEVLVQGTNTNPNSGDVPADEISDIGSAIADDGLTNITELPNWTRVRRDNISGGGTVKVSIAVKGT